MKDYLYWVCENVAKDMFSGFDTERAWEMAMTYATTRDLSTTKYSISNYLEARK